RAAHDKAEEHWSKEAKRAVLPEPAKKTWRLTGRLAPGKTPATATAEMVVEGMASNALTVAGFSESPFESLDLTECMVALSGAVAAVQSGDLKGPEALLSAQAISLNTVY